MKMIGERVIAYLKADSSLVTLLGNVRNIYAKGLNEPDNRPSKYVCIECSPGEDLKFADGQQDEFDVEVGVSRKIENSFSTIMEIVSAVDDLLNKKENLVSTASWKIKSLIRMGSPTAGPLIDDKTNEYFFQIKYAYILDESS